MSLASTVISFAPRAAASRLQGVRKRGADALSGGVGVHVEHVEGGVILKGCKAQILALDLHDDRHHSRQPLGEGLGILGRRVTQASRWSSL